MDFPEKTSSIVTLGQRYHNLTALFFVREEKQLVLLTNWNESCTVDGNTYNICKIHALERKIRSGFF